MRRAAKPDRKGTARPKAKKTNRNYIRGRAFEWEILNVIKSHHGWYAIRAAGSHGKYDIIAGRKWITWAFQLKTRVPTKEETEDLVHASLGWWAYHCMVWKGVDGRPEYKAWCNGLPMPQKHTPPIFPDKPPSTEGEKSEE